jgi:tetrahydromethanopterin S-methyltransferase subunit A
MSDSSRNTLANPNIRFLIVCGPDARQAVGHLPGQALVALAQAGTDERGRIIGALAKRPVLRNIEPAAIAHFRQTVEVVDLIGTTETALIQRSVQACAARDLGPAPAYETAPVLQPIRGYEPVRLVQDPAGYLVVYVDRARGLLALERYQSHGTLDTIIEGRTAVEVYTPVIDRGLITRLDHAAYLGGELARAERALATGEAFVQDAAPGR